MRHMIQEIKVLGDRLTAESPFFIFKILLDIGYSWVHNELR